MKSEKHILLVDDEQLLCWTLKSVFEDEGYTTTCCMSVFDAMAALRGTAFDLVITDYRLPDGSGYEVAAFAKDLSRVSAVIMLTADTDSRETTLPISSVDEVVAKPFDVDEFRQVAFNYLERKQEMKQTS